MTFFFFVCSTPELVCNNQRLDLGTNLVVPDLTMVVASGERPRVIDSASGPNKQKKS